MSKAIIRIIVATSLLGTLLASAFGSAACARGDKVYVNEELVLTLKYGSAESLGKRATNIALRLSKLDGQSPLTLQGDGSERRIVSGDFTVLTVSEDEASAQGQSLDDVAGAWLTNIRAALALPPIQLGKSEVKLQSGAKAQVATLGSEVDQATVTNSNPEVAAILHKQDVLFIRAIAVGESNITLTGPTTTKSIRVVVQPMAADLPQTIEVEVTGDPTTQETVAGAVEGAIRTKVMCQPGAELQYTLPAVSGLAIEGSQTIQVPVHVAAPNSFPSEGNVQVQVHNLPLAAKHEAQLWYSNYPEDICKVGNLFAAELEEESPARLLYHHFNKTDGPLDVSVRVINNSSLPARLLIIPGDSPPNRNPVLAGYKAGTILEELDKFLGRDCDSSCKFGASAFTQKASNRRNSKRALLPQAPEWRPETALGENGRREYGQRGLGRFISIWDIYAVAGPRFAAYKVRRQRCQVVEEVLSNPVPNPKCGLQSWRQVRVCHDWAEAAQKRRYLAISRRQLSGLFTQSMRKWIIRRRFRLKSKWFLNPAQAILVAYLLWIEPLEPGFFSLKKKRL